MNLTDVMPVQDANSSVWFEAASNEKLLLQRDPLTGKSQFYPRAHVMGAPERTPEWFEASGRGTLYSYSVVHRSIHPQFTGMTPFVIALVDLEEGVRVTTWIVDVPVERLRCDMDVKVVFRDIHKDLKLPCFTEA
ncbi:OB-fold domain-containing protein [Pseudomonas sp. B21-056]|jgi:uncharacterized OB-fold protein|uniref:Zn-ribbon domain-containing OB-fold protein n=1 Tax=Pseudomonas sp. B21-056 TaxID=2895495 RepID=UPI0022306D7D|nr:OB-fold domain-containing protein [Pseudomonas sp. B21-056]UZE26374.1 OB-fold domain-containing protein [Pseudomonas sp. B21-056]